MAIEVPMSWYVCPWCGCPWMIPTAMSNNTNVTKRCPSGHRLSDGRTEKDDLKLERENSQDRARRVAELNQTVRYLRGRVTHLKRQIETSKS